MFVTDASASLIEEQTMLRMKKRKNMPTRTSIAALPLKFGTCAKLYLPPDGSPRTEIAGLLRPVVGCARLSVEVLDLDLLEHEHDVLELVCVVDVAARV